jgi:pyruvate dehydrogenase E2 component (dihydrolipoamide acetyltransferase)
MATEVRLPQWSMGMHDGTIVRWLKKEGEPVAAGEPLAEIEAAKVNGVLEAPAAGVLFRILVREGESVPVRTVLCLVGAPNEMTEPAAARPEREPAPTPAAARTEPAGVQATPVARRLALDHGIDLNRVQASGPGGRIVEDDVLRARAAASQPGPQAIPMTGLRATIARRMAESLQTMAQVTLSTGADVTDLVALREDLRQRDDVTITGLVVCAVALALREHPRLNAHLDGQSLQVHPDVHVGVAVALDEGLIVPVVRNADQKSLRDIAREVRLLSQKAREGILAPGEASGSTFTVTNLGMYGVDTLSRSLTPRRWRFSGSDASARDR